MAKTTFDTYSTTAHELLHGLESGHFTSKEIVQAYLRHIAETNDRLRAVIEVCPIAVDEAIKRDRERRDGFTRGPLHGLPILIKANISTRSEFKMETTTGNFVLSGSRPRQNADVVQQLLDSGAIIIGKASLSELSYWKTQMIPAGWSPIGGQGQNAYVHGGRQPGDAIFTFNGPGGSSSGPAIGVSSGHSPVAIGTETSGSLILPANLAALYTIKATLGIVPQGGIVPVSLRFDTAGPMAKCSRDVALLLDVLVDGTRTRIPEGGYISSAVGNTAWKGLKVGVLDPAKWFYEDALVGYKQGQKEQIIQEVTAAYEKVGTKVKELRRVSVKSWSDTSSLRKGCGPLMGKLFEYDYRRDFEQYLGTLENCRIQSLEDILTPDDKYAALALPEGRGGEEALQRAISCTITGEEASAIELEMRDKSRTHGIDGALKDHDVDVLLGPGSGPLYMLAAAAAGKISYPIATLPLSYLDSNGCPFGLVALASAHQEALLVSVQAAWEDTFPARRAPILGSR